MSDALTVLAAARDALRSYQHGNAAPDLAREVADACDRILGRPAEARRPSLTPNEDIARVLLATAPDLAGAAEPGSLGSYTRLLIAMREARVIAIARELDRATPLPEIVSAFARATADEIFVVAGFGPPGFRERLTGEIARMVERTADLYARGERDGTRYSVVPVSFS